jgi:rod shape-determining protein MreC
MENFLSRYRNPVVLAAVLLLQIFGLAVQVRRPLDPGHPDAGSVRLVRLWVAEIVTPLDRVVLAIGRGAANGWHDYVNLGGLRRENDQLKADNARLQIEQAQLSEQAKQAHRLQQLLDFQPKFIGATLPAQVIGTSGTEQSNLVYIDKGKRSGVKPDMAVIVPGGVVGKVREVYSSSAQVLLINDPTSGVGAILANSRLYGVVKGNARGGLLLDHIMTDEKVEAGEQVITSGGDRIFPKGLAIGSVEKVSQGRDLFWDIRVKPAVDLDRVEEVLVVTQMQGAQLESAEAPPVRASDILAQRLPGIAHRDAVSNPAAQTTSPAAKMPKADGSAKNNLASAAATNPKSPAASANSGSMANPKPVTAKTGSAPPKAGAESPKAESPKPAALKPDATKPAAPAQPPPAAPTQPQ